MAYYLVLHSTYDGIQVALFDKESLVSFRQETKFNASKNLIHIIKDMLTKQNISFLVLTFIVVNQGPAPFTTLRTVLASVNGFNLATGIPLIGVNSLTAFAREHTSPDYPVSIYMLNAFAQDIYYCIDHAGVLQTGCQNIETFLNDVAQRFALQASIRFLGNGVLLYRTLIETTFGHRAYIPSEPPVICSLTYLARIGYEQWQEKEWANGPLQPLYLKNHTAQYKQP